MDKAGYKHKLQYDPTATIGPKGKRYRAKLELQQERSLGCILGLDYRSNSHALTLTSLPRLYTLRGEACLKWAIKAQANPHHSDLFPLNPSHVDTRHKKKFKEYNCKILKDYKSAILTMGRALNSNTN